MAELHSYIGLDRVKKDIAELVNSITVDQMRRAKGLRMAERSQHMVFYGNPGTGKTTVAALVAKIYKAIGVVSRGHLIVTDRAGLIGEYLGQTAPKVKEVVQSALGGILFIDEAYSLVPADSHRDYGQEAIQQLMLLMEEHRKDLVVIVAGYKDEMARFLDSNPGLRSRFTKKLLFDDYTPEQLVQIFKKFCLDKDYRLDEAAGTKLLRLFRIAYSRRDRTFGNGRLVRNCFEKATANLANRVVRAARPSRLTMMTLVDSDIPDPDAVSDPSDQPRFFPDLGTYLAGQGHPQKTMFIYPTFEIVNLAVVGPGHYCATQNAVLDDEREYCGTFDFGDDILEEILARAPGVVTEKVRSELAADSESVRTIVLPVPVSVGIAATLGQMQIGLREKFIPLLVAEVFG